MTEPTIQLQKDLEVWYEFSDEEFDNQRGVIRDKSGYGRHAEANGGPIVGVNGPASFEGASFDGSDDQFVPPDETITYPFSVYALVKFDGVSQNPVYTKSRYTDARSGRNEFTLSALDTGNFIFEVSDSDSTVGVSQPYSVGEWYSAVGVVSSDDLRFIVNGELIGVSDASGITEAVDTGNVLTIGESNDGMLGGDIATVARWSRALSWAEIQHLNEMTAPHQSTL